MNKDTICKKCGATLYKNGSCPLQSKTPPQIDFVHNHSFSNLFWGGLLFLVIILLIGLVGYILN